MSEQIKCTDTQRHTLQIIRQRLAYENPHWSDDKREWIALQRAGILGKAVPMR